MSIVRTSRIILTITFCAATVAVLAGCDQPKPDVRPEPKLVVKPAPKPARPLGYQNTPLIPGTKWHVHDGLRPQPDIVTPKPLAGPVPPPPGAIVLFDGKDLSKWKNKNWKLKDGYMQAAKGTQISVDTFGDMQLHIEWATPKVVKGVGQGRGNSGVFPMGKYEIQVLDSYNNQTYPDGQAAAVYGQYPPLLNASRPPGEWQTYDITFIAPRFKDGKLVSPARVTVIHNGILVQDNVRIMGLATHKRVAKYAPHAPVGPISLQDHGNPVRFRNIWVKPLKK